MKTGIALGATAFALLLAGCGDEGANGGNLTAAAANETVQLEQVPAPDGGSWTDVVARTEEGGLLVGNPDAPVKLVEFASYTCPACAQFARTGMPELMNEYVRSGQVAFELRSFVRSAPDAAMTLLLQCQPEGAALRTSEQMFERQQELLGSIDEEEAQRLQALPESQQIPALARAMDLDTFMARRGLPEARFEECLSDQQALLQLAERTQSAVEQYNVPGTPAFLINGELVDASQWEQLEPRLRAALRR